MLIVDKLLQRREEIGKPVRVGLVGAGFAGKGFALQLLAGTVGMRLVAISNRTVAEAAKAFEGAGVKDAKLVQSARELQNAIERNQHAFTDDAMLLASSPQIDVIVEATGEIDFAARVALEAFANGKHFVCLNAELDATLGPILNVLAARARPDHRSSARCTLTKS